VTCAEKRSPRGFAGWTTREIVVAAVLSVAVGVVFWVWDLLYSSVFSAMPFPLSYAVNGVWMVGGLLVPLVIRRPGSAIFGEFVAAFVSMLLVNQWGAATLLSGLVQGAGAELVFAAFLWRRFDLPVVLLAAVGAQVPSYLLDSVLYGYWTAYTTGAVLAGWVIAVVSALVLGGLVAWGLAQALARTGVLAGFPIGNAHQRRV
jgi:energy-coupling factor transport system substrate-specific component